MGLFSKPTKQSVALIDIGSRSVGGAYAHIEPLSPPTIYYTSRVPIEVREGETPEAGMIRSLAQLGNILVNHGAPILRQETGDARIDAIIASVGAPWQRTTVRVASRNEEKPFVFTKRVMDEIVEEDLQSHPEFAEGTGSVIATILNGYDVADPFGKRAHRADLVVLSSTLNREVSHEITHALQKVFHTHAVTLTAFAPLSYAVLRDMYPHEKDFLILEVNGTATDLAFVKRGLLADVASVPQGTNALLDAVSKGHATLSGSGQVIDPLRNNRFAELVDKTEEAWLSGLTTALKCFSEKHALPRSVFLLSDAEALGYLERLLDTPAIHSLWLSDEPLSVIPLSPKHLSQYVRTRGAGEGDVFLAMMALYSSKGIVSSGT